MASRAQIAVVAAVLSLVAWPAAAQEYAAPQTHATPAHISHVEGAVALERDGQLDRSPRSMPLLTGDRLRTEGGRAEVLFADGSAMHVDAGTLIDFQSDEVVRLLAGRIRLSIVDPGHDVFYRVDAPAAWVEVLEAGEYRVTVPATDDVELAVLRGAAALVNEQGRSDVRAGEQTFARPETAPTQPYVFNSAAWDAFDRWSEDRRTQRLGRSAQYLPADVRSYAATFDTYGAWQYEPAYGYVWYPRVAAGWRPYYHGRWATLRPYGWTWIAADPWGWPTHHYGRWGFSAGVWFWIPGRHWGPAWVSWAYTPHYVSWCPLGWNNRPVVQIVNVNIGVGRRFSPWDAWTVVPRRHFSGRFVNVATIGSVRIDQRVQQTFVVRDRAPEARFAVARDSSPIRSAGRYAVPRSGAGTAASATTVRPDAGRRLTSPGAAATSGERRLPPPARAPGTAVATRTVEGATAGRAVARQPDNVSSPSGSRATSAAGPATGRVVSPSGQGSDEATARRGAGASTDRSSAGSGSPVRAVPRGRPPAADSAPAGSGRPTAPSATPGRARSTATQPAAPTRRSVAPATPSRPATPTAPGTAPAREATPSVTPSAARPRASAAEPAIPAVAVPSGRTRSETATGWGRATAPATAQPSAAPAPRTRPSRPSQSAPARTGAASEPAGGRTGTARETAPPAAGPASRAMPARPPGASSASPASRQPRQADAAAGSARQRPAETSSGQRGRRRE
jgi:hypothetical protein